ncbi:MAG: hypothetical protein WCI27_03760 [Candidatus Omnitrophota bacterium]
MKRLLGMLLLVPVLAGCSSIPVPVVSVVSVAPVAALPSDRLSIGMTRAEVVAIMAAQIVVGYEMNAVAGVSKPVKAQNLYSSELVVVKGATYQVDRYIVREPAPGAKVALDALFPVVYKDGLLTAKGRDGLAGIMANEK